MLLGENRNMKNLYATLLSITLCFLASPSWSEFLLFSDSGSFHGCLDCSRYDTNSICNKYGDYGSQYSSNSIWNKYGIGSEYDSNSPFNKYGQGLKIVDRSGNFYGYLSVGYSGNNQMRKVFKGLWDASGGDYGTMQDIFCN